MIAGGPEDEQYDGAFDDGVETAETFEDGVIETDPVEGETYEADPFAGDDTEGELALGDDDDLPWLESGEDDHEAGVDTGRIVGFVLIGLLALAAILGGIWWATNRGNDTELLADGSTIPAPEGPVKTRPDDPGGEQVAGTGDVAPLAGEGEEIEGRVAEADAPVPSLDVRSADHSASDEAGAGDAPSESVASGVAVQVGAYSSRARAEEGWQTLTGQSEALSGVRHRVVQGTADIGTVYRLQAMAGSASAASDLCRRLKADGVACQVKN